MRLNKLIRLDKIVKEILEDEPLAREDDNYLILLVIQRIDPELVGTTFVNVMLKAKNKGISMESITRARRKVQQKYPDLCDEETKIKREEEEEYYKEYSHIPRID